MSKSRYPRHQNTYAWKPRSKAKRTRQIHKNRNKILECLCEDCRKIIEWRIQMCQYKPLKQPKKCQMCNQKTVVKAYRLICQNCVKENGYLCGKCAKNKVPESQVLKIREKELDKELQKWDKIRNEEKREERLKEIREKYKDIDFEIN